MDLTDFQKYLQYERRYSKHTVSSYIKDLEQFLGFLKDEFDLEPTEINHHQIRAWVVQLMDTQVSARTVTAKYLL